MKRWHCPRCGYERLASPEIVGIQHTCPLEPGCGLVRLESGTKTFELYCGDCRGLFRVPKDDVPDGELWLCATCRPITVDVETELV